MKRRYIAVLAGCLTAVSACSDWLDVNTNPNGPQSVSANLYLPPMLHWMATAPQYDGRFVGRYTQEWTLPGTALSTWDRMGYDPGSDNGGEQWRDVYWSFGQNLVDMNRKAEAEQRWDLLGVGQILKGWGWMVLTDLHGPIIIKEAFDQTRTTFDYDSEKYAYEESQRLFNAAIANLKRTDGAVDQAYLARGDHVYNGDRTKWLKFANGMLAINLNHFTDRPGYNPDSVIKLVDLSFTSNADDALNTYPATNNDDTNFWGRTRANLPSYRQTQFVVALMDGTDFGVADPRLSRMLAIDSANTTYRGLDPNIVGFGALTPAQQPRNFYGFTGTGGVGVPGRYLFSDKAKIPIMTYSQLQFVKAEAAFRKGDKATALDAYKKGVAAHIDFVNARNTDDNQSVPQISSAEKAAFLANTAIVPTDPNALTLTQIMTQKYIAQWGWGHNELWMDMRRFHYTDVDPATGQQVYPGFKIPTSLYVDNAGLPVYRIRPRYNSEYVWNQPGLSAIGALDPAYHTKLLWILDPSQP
jgi:Starch-binding associating with outer membrane